MKDNKIFEGFNDRFKEDDGISIQKIDHTDPPNRPCNIACEDEAQDCEGCMTGYQGCQRSCERMCQHCEDGCLSACERSCQGACQTSTQGSGNLPTSTPPSVNVQTSANSATIILSWSDSYVNGVQIRCNGQLSNWIYSAGAPTQCVLTINNLVAGTYYSYEYLLTYRDNRANQNGSGNFVTDRIPVQSIALDNISTLEVGEVRYLRPTVYPTNATNRNVMFLSYDQSIVTVDTNGVLRAIRPGTCNIGVSSSDNPQIGVVKSVTVKEPRISVQSITLDDIGTLEVGQTKQLRPTVYPTNATNRNVMFLSYDQSIVTVDTNGVLRAIRPGTCNVGVSSSDNPQIGVVKSVTVKEPRIPVQNLILEEIGTLEVGQTRQLKYTISPSNATIKKDDILFKSYDPGIVSVDKNGLLTALKLGKCDVAVYSFEDTGVVGSVKSVTVKEPRIAVQSIALDDIGTLEVGEVRYLRPTVYPTNATNRNVMFFSYDSSIVTVDTNGALRAIRPGTCNIGVSSSDNPQIGVVKSVTVKKSNIPVQSITLEDIGTLEVGQTKQLRPTVYPTNATNRDVMFLSYDQSIVTVDTNGALRAIRPGTCNIGVSSSDNPQIGVVKSVTVKEPRIPVQSITLDDIGTLKVGEIKYLKYKIEPVSATNHRVIFKSSNTDVAVVSENGVLTALKQGNTTITITSDDNSYISASKSVNVMALSGKIEINSYIVTDNGTGIEITYDTSGDVNKIIAECLDEETGKVAAKIEVPIVSNSTTLKFKGLTPNNGYIVMAGAYKDNTVIDSAIWDIITDFHELPAGTIELESYDQTHNNISLVFNTIGITNKVIVKCCKNGSVINTFNQNIEGTVNVEFNNLEPDTDYVIMAEAYNGTLRLDTTELDITTESVPEIYVDEIPDLQEGEQHKIKLYISPSIEDNYNVTVSSNNTSIIDIDKEEELTLNAINEGECDITITAIPKDNRKIDVNMKYANIENSSIGKINGNAKQLTKKAKVKKNNCAVSITSPGRGRIVPLLDKMLVSADISQNPKNVKFYYAPSESSISSKNYKGELISPKDAYKHVKNGQQFVYYGGSWTPAANFPAKGRPSDWIKGNLTKPKVPGRSMIIWHMPKIVVETIKNNDSKKDSVSVYVPLMQQDDYKIYLKPNVRINLEKDIVGVATSYYDEMPQHNDKNTYNCLAYAVGIYDKWQWPLGSNPSKKKLKEYIESVILSNGKKYGQVEVVDIKYDKKRKLISNNFKTRIIYYDGLHFAKVVSYDKNGNPNKIRSKWGNNELIDSPDFNPFSDGEDCYGNAKYFVNYTNTNRQYNKDLGEYYNATDFRWDSKRKRYVDRDFFPIDALPHPDSSAVVLRNDKEEWLVSHKDSINIIDKSIVKYCEEVSKDTSLLKKSFYSPEEDNKLYIMKDLGVKRIPEILERIKAKEPFSGTLMVTVEELLKVHPEIISVSDDGIDKWIKALNDRIINAPKVVKASIESLNVDTSNETIEKVKKDIYNIGILAIPYIEKAKSTISSLRVMLILRELLTQLYGQNTIDSYTNNSTNMNELIVTVNGLYDLLTKGKDEDPDPCKTCQTGLVPCRYQCEKVSQKPCKNDMACHGCLRLRQHGDEF